MLNKFNINDCIEANAKGMVKVYEVEGVLNWELDEKTYMFSAMTGGGYDVYDCTPGCIVITSIDCLKFNSMTDYHKTDDEAKLRIISVSDDKWYHELFEEFIADFYENKAVKVYECERTPEFKNQVTEILKEGIGGEFFTMEQSPFVANVVHRENDVFLSIEAYETETIREYIRAYRGYFERPQIAKVLFARPRFENARHALWLFDKLFETIHKEMISEKAVGMVDISLDMCYNGQSAPEFHFVIASVNEAEKIERIINNACLEVIEKEIDDHGYVDFMDYEDNIYENAKYMWCFKRIDGEYSRYCSEGNTYYVDVSDKKDICLEDIPSLTANKTQKRTADYYDLQNQILLGTYSDDIA